MGWGECYWRKGGRWQKRLWKYGGGMEVGCAEADKEEDMEDVEESRKAGGP